MELLLDIDHLKRVNDTHGHDVGDTVLVTVSRLAEDVIGTRGRVYRWVARNSRSQSLAGRWPNSPRWPSCAPVSPAAGSRWQGSLTGSIGHGTVTRTESCKIDRALRQAKEGNRNQAVETVAVSPHMSGSGESAII